MQLVLDAGSLAMAVAAVGGLLGALWRYLIAPARRWLSDVHRIVTRELQANSGSSIKDRVEAMVDRLDEHQVEADGRDERLDRIESKLDQHLHDTERHHREQHRANVEQHIDHIRQERRAQ